MDKDSNESKPALDIAMSIPNNDVVTMLNEGKAQVRVFIYDKNNLYNVKMLNTSNEAPIWWDNYYRTFSTRFNTQICPNCYVAVMVLDAEAMAKVSKEAQKAPAEKKEEDGEDADADPDSELSFSSVLSLGAEGNDVAALQTKLAELGYYNGEITAQFDEATDAAVKAFQADNGLDVDGYVGPATLSAINAAEAPAEKEIIFMEEEIQDEEVVDLNRRRC